MKTDDIREAYLSFFESKGCVRKPSDVLVPNDPTVLFTGAGMNQFKREFMGLGDPSFKKATTCQMCIRTGDIDNVGRTPRHMTFFEMLGNFSFGDYFKPEAIHWAWELLTKVLKIDPNRLTVTVYQDDDEAFGIWNREIGLAPDRITRMGEADNFWPASAPSEGPNGVCGPCSEIFYQGDGLEPVEIWNLVFTQFNRVGFQELEPLPAKNIDTGMGLERMAAAMQGVRSNFEIDIFQPMVAAASEAVGVKYERDTPNGVRIRRMADHARALTFTIHENVRPGPEKQGYVIRRLLRRAVLDAYQMGRREPFLYKLPPVVAEMMKRPYPDLAESVVRVQNLIKLEEEQFLRNLENGLKVLSDTFRRTAAGGHSAVSGKDAFELHATYGIPVEVTQSLAGEQNLAVDMEGFTQAQEEHSRVSRGTTEAAAVFTLGPVDEVKKRQKGQGTEFLGYQGTEATAKVVGLVAGDSVLESAHVDHAHKKLIVVLDRTPFYGESGGQMGDTGTSTGPGFVFQVDDTQKEADLFLHIGRLLEGEIKTGQDVKASVDETRRQAIRRAHSATHVLHHALHIHLGKHAQQAGSKVEPDRLRFDFANPEAVGRDRLKQIEKTVNERIMKGEPIGWSVMPIADARAKGAMALFGEKYPENVRVVEMGDFSRELCGGTHLDNVGQIGMVRIVGEESVSAGTRRITALTGPAALEQMTGESETLSELGALLKVSQGQIVTRVNTLLEEIKALKKQATSRKAEGGGRVPPDQLIAEAPTVNGVKVVVAEIDGMTTDDLKQLVDVLRRKADGKNLATLLIAKAEEGKVTIVAGLTPDLVARKVSAGLWVKDVAPVVNGGGGGKPDMASAGGKDQSKIAEALQKAREVIVEKLG
ncbi:MAG: alanine--tRNA ligase [bacterium]